MNSSPIDEYGQLYNMIMSIPDDLTEWSEDQLKTHMQKLKKCGKDTYDKMKKLSQEFTELSKKNLELEEKITLLYENLDRQREAMLDYDVETYRKSCVEQYEKIWNELEENSREFLITAVDCQVKLTHFFI